MMMDSPPSHYEEMQDYYGGDDWDHGQFDSPEDYAPFLGENYETAQLDTQGRKP